MRLRLTIPGLPVRVEFDVPTGHALNYHFLYNPDRADYISKYFGLRLRVEIIPEAPADENRIGHTLESKTGPVDARLRHAREECDRLAAKLAVAMKALDDLNKSEAAQGWPLNMAQDALDKIAALDANKIAMGTGHLSAPCVLAEHTAWDKMTVPPNQPDPARYKHAEPAEQPWKCANCYCDLTAYHFPEGLVCPECGEKVSDPPKSPRLDATCEQMEANAGGQIPPASGGNLDRLVRSSESKGE